MKKLELSAIRIDGGTQSRSFINEEIVAEYAEAMRANTAFPPVTIFYDGANHWLADGFHRYHATHKAELPDIHADIRSGTRRDSSEERPVAKECVITCCTLWPPYQSKKTNNKYRNSDK